MQNNYYSKNLLLRNDDLRTKRLRFGNNAPDLDSVIFNSESLISSAFMNKKKSVRHLVCDFVWIMSTPVYITGCTT